MEEKNSRKASHPPRELTTAEIGKFGEVFKTYYARLCYFSFQITGDKALAEDICQEAFIRYWHQRENVAGTEGAVKGYLYAAVRNASLSLLRHDKVVKRYMEEREAAQVEEITIIHSMIRSEVVAEIYHALGTLPAGCRQVVQMAYLEGMKNKEIASKLGVSVNTVKTQRQRALQLLRSRISFEAFALLLLLNTHSF